MGGRVGRCGWVLPWVNAVASAVGERGRLRCVHRLVCESCKRPLGPKYRPAGAAARHVAVQEKTQAERPTVAFHVGHLSLSALADFAVSAMTTPKTPRVLLVRLQRLMRRGYRGAQLLLRGGRAALPRGASAIATKRERTIL